MPATDGEREIGSGSPRLPRRPPGLPRRPPGLPRRPPGLPRRPPGLPARSPGLPAWSAGLVSRSAGLVSRSAGLVSRSAGPGGTGGISAAAEVQRRLWGTDPRAWADLAEAHNRPLFEAVLDAAGVGHGTRVLDVGCGSGLTLVLAAQRGATPSGLDISPGLLGLARERLPEADLREGDMESLPFGDTSVDAVVGVNAFQFAGDPRRALREAARVVRPGGRVVASLFAAPDRSQGTVVHEAMSALIQPEQADDHAP
jgi:Methyltransferase domain